MRRALSLFRDWPLMLLALVLSFALWALFTAEPLAEAAYNVPVIFRNLPAGMDLSGSEAMQVHLVLRGRATVLRRLQPQDMTLQVDLGGRTDTEFSVSFSAANLDVPLGVEVARFAPADMRVRLVPRTP